VALNSHSSSILAFPPSRVCRSGWRVRTYLWRTPSLFDYVPIVTLKMWLWCWLARIWAGLLRLGDGGQRVHEPAGGGDRGYPSAAPCIRIYPCTPLPVWYTLRIYVQDVYTCIRIYPCTPLPVWYTLRIYVQDVYTCIRIYPCAPLPVRYTLRIYGKGVCIYRHPSL
jgi:hypothetical protein